MSGPGRGALRVVRGVLLAACCTGLGVAGHGLGGGGLPALTPTLLASALLAAASVLAADRQRSPAALAAAAVGSQVVLHVASCLGPDLAASAGHSVVADGRMVAGHLLAAAVLGLLLARGDAVLWALWRLLAAVLPQVVRLLVAEPPLRRLPTGARADTVRPGLRVASARLLRGPPPAPAA